MTETGTTKPLTRGAADPAGYASDARTNPAGPECFCGSELKRVPLPPDMAAIAERPSIWVHEHNGDTRCYPESANPEDAAATGTPADGEPPAIPPPAPGHHAYGVALDGLGEDGAMVAFGHIPDLRFVAACNHMARKELGLRNLWDDRGTSLADVLATVIRPWAVAVDPAIYAIYGCEWAISWQGITEDTPGAFPVTVMVP